MMAGNRRLTGRIVMRKLVLAIAAAALLSGCSTIDGIWESEARKNCQSEQGATRQSDCNDRVDTQVRENRR